MDEIYRAPEAELLTQTARSLKRWDFKLAWRLLSKKYLVLVALTNFLQLWTMSYVDMIKYIESQGDNPKGIGHLNIFLEMLDFGLVIGSLASCIVTGLIPFLIVSYKQTQKSCLFAQILWFALILLLATLIWMNRFWIT